MTDVDAEPSGENKPDSRGTRPVMTMGGAETVRENEPDSHFAGGGRQGLPLWAENQAGKSSTGIGRAMW